VKIPLLLLSAVLLPAPDVVLGLAAANSASFLVGAVAGQLLLRRRLGRIPTGAVLSTVGRALLAALVAGLLAFGAVQLVGGLLAGSGPPARAWLELVVAVLVIGPVSVLGMRLLRVREMNPFVSRLERLVDRRRPRRRGVR
jgi:putative peptidoglycan lipid II flippase